MVTRDRYHQFPTSYPPVVPAGRTAHYPGMLPAMGPFINYDLGRVGKIGGGSFIFGVLVGGGSFIFRVLVGGGSYFFRVLIFGR